jgi:hypothetical protein
MVESRVREVFHEHRARRLVMRNRLRVLGTILIVGGVAFVIGGGVAYAKVQDGYDALQAFSEVQNVTLAYDDDGRLTDRGTTEGADAILTMLRDEWRYPVVDGDFDPDDPLVNTATEYMYQMATIVYHVIGETVTVVLDDPVEFNGETFEAGEYEFDIDGRYWTGFDRTHPLEGPARELAWTGTVHGLVGELGVGTVTHTTLQMGLGLAALLAGLGLMFMLTGVGLVWAGAADRRDRAPDTVPEALTVDDQVDVPKAPARQ